MGKAGGQVGSGCGLLQEGGSRWRQPVRFFQNPSMGADSRISPCPSSLPTPGWRGPGRLGSGELGLDPGSAPSWGHLGGPLVQARLGRTGLSQPEYEAPPPWGLAHAVGASHPCVTEHTREGSWEGIWGGGGGDSRPGSAGRPSWAGGCRRRSSWAGAASAASPAAWPAPGGSRVARHPGPSTTGRRGCRQRVV